MTITNDHWDDDAIHAFVDGELDPALAQRIEAQCRNDAALASRVERQRRLRSRLAAAFDPVLDEPIPASLSTAVNAQTGSALVTPIGNARSRKTSPVRNAWSVKEWSAIAASLVFGALVSALMLRQSAAPFRNSTDGMIATGYLDAALTSQPSGTIPEDSAASVALSFRATDGRYCRVFSLRTGAQGLACRNGQQWRVETLESQSASGGSAQDYRQAGSALSATLLSAIGQRGGAVSLTPEQESQLLQNRWSR